MTRQREPHAENQYPTQSLEEQHAHGAVTRHGEPRHERRARIAHGREQSTGDARADTEAGRFRSGVAPARDRQSHPRHHEEGEEQPRRRERLLQDHAREDCDHDGCGVQQRRGSGDAGAGDRKLIRDLEQGH